MIARAAKLKYGTRATDDRNMALSFALPGALAKIV
jgi:hypothetical protein